MAQPALTLDVHPHAETLIDRTLELFQPLTSRPLTREDAREALDNLVAAYRLLLHAHTDGGAQ